MEDKTTLDIEALKSFLDSSPMSFQAVATVASTLDAAGFIRLYETDKWALHPGGRYYVVKNDSAIFAFIVGDCAASAGVKIISAHSDSPGFRIKPNPVMKGEGGVTRLNTEVYGGPILYTWFDRPLSIAGRVMLRGSDPLRPVTKLVKSERPLLTIPHLAIHFNRAVNEGNPLSRQKDMMPVLGIINESLGVADDRLFDALGVDRGEVIGYELGLYDTTKARLTGLDNEFVTSGRLDDLSMVHAAMTALISSADSDSRSTRVMAVFDNEETGSGTKQGAASPVLLHILRRINMALGGGEEDFLRSLSGSFMVSADNAHGLHPNYPEKQDPTNHPQLGGGPVIKVNANCKYMTDADSAAVFATVCAEAGVPYQYFVNHSDVAGGSTLGNILTSQIDLRGVDMGAAIWAMHSVRETASVVDHSYIISAFSKFFNL